ncbi:hypothetical protein NDU88_004413 [Pleurodeles waltl]|uniref:Superoxide dismutase copper/zinc binding domain-containing protein n=1 Tax=Pleurodeles waltl TaxID=8319 RepID=A0AAV7PCX2_PLEWA|nr:hypothetical protein NDU88_004413 [Pleurodeles waltl]
MGGIKGYIEINSLQKTAVQNLTSTCEGVISVSLHEFPVMYGHYSEPCGQANIGDQLYTFTFNKSEYPSGAFNVSGLFGAITDMDDLSLVVKMCNSQACGNLQKQGVTVRTWQAKFYNSVLGEAYFRQQGGNTSLTVLTDLVTARAEESSALNVSMYLATTCNLYESTANFSVGVLKVGILPTAIKSGLRVPNITVQQYASLRFKDRWVCAELHLLEPKSVNAIIDMNGVKGLFKFTQVSPFDPTQISVDLRNASGLEKYYHVHKFPVPQRRDPSENLCDQNSTGDHWNPFNANVSAASYPKGPGATHDLYEIGDLSGKHGPLEGMNRSSSAFQDWNLPLFGRNSIVGRSIVIHKVDNARLACGSIGYGGEVITGIAVFRTMVVGRVIFRQLKSNPYSDLSIYIDLSYSNASALLTYNHNWYVLEFPISTETDADMKACSSTEGHFNPTRIEVNVNYSLHCQPQSPFLCEVGDFAGKHKPLNLTSYARSVHAKAFFTDTTSALSGFASFLGKSLVIYGAGQALTRNACANITLLRPSVGKTGQWFGSKQVEGEFNVSQPVELDPTAISTSFTKLRSICGGYHVHLLPITQNTPEACADILIKGHFNPFLINMTLSPSPGTGTVDKYEVGDISGKYGTLAGKDAHFEQYLDSNLPLSGPYSILRRSLVIHYINGSR